MDKVGTKVLRVPEATHSEATQMAALRGSSAGQLLADAWREYMEHHREEFAGDLEEVARLMRDGTLDQLAEFTSRNAEQRAAGAIERRESKQASGKSRGAADAEPVRA